MTYTVKYKLQGSWFWRTIKGVKADHVSSDQPCRVFILDDESRVEFPFGTAFMYSNGRFLVIKQNMENESGLALSTKK